MNREKIRSQNKKRGGSAAGSEGNRAENIQHFGLLILESLNGISRY